MAKKLKWMQTEAGRRAQSKRMKARWARKRAEGQTATAIPIATDNSNQHYGVYLTTFRADKLLEVLRAVKANRLEIHILD